MKNKKKMGGDPLRWKYLNLVDYILPFYLICTAPMLYFGLYYDYLFKGLAITITLIYLLRFRCPINRFTGVFSVFFLLVLFSFIQYAYNNRNINCYFNEASNYLAAMLFYYVGVTDDRPGRTFYNKFVVAIAAVLGIGFYFFITTPSWYLSRNLEFLNAISSVTYNENNMLEQMRFSAFFGDSYAVSHYSVFCSAIALFGITYSEGRRRTFFVLLLTIGVISSIASMHRASIVGTIICLLLYLLFNHKVKRLKNNVLFVLAIIAILVVVLSFSFNLGSRISDIIGQITGRVDDNMNFNKALQERKYTKSLMSSMQYFFFGHGLGSGGISARAYGFAGVTDMQYIKMFYENGIVGMLMFVIIILSALKRGIKYIKYYFTEVSIILFILVAMTGSNSLSIYYFIVFPFWYVVGRISNDKYFQHLIKKEWI